MLWMNKNDVDIYFTKRAGDIKRVIVKMIADDEMNGSMFSNLYLYILDRCPDIETDDDLWRWIISYLNIQKYWNKTDYLKEKYILEGSVCNDLNDRRSGVKSIPISYDIEYIEDEYNDSIDRDLIDLESRVNNLQYEFKILYNLIFYRGLSSNEDISKELKCKPSDVSPLKRKLKEQLGIDTKIYWNAKKIKRIWK
jgi:hypothetical protein